MTHELKTWPQYFEKVKSGEKTFEIRKNDRDFQTGDVIILKEFFPTGYSPVCPNELIGKYTGEELQVKVTYVFKGLPDGRSFGLLGDYCCMSIKIINH